MSYIDETITNEQLSPEEMEDIEEMNMQYEIDKETTRIEDTGIIASLLTSDDELKKAFERTSNTSMYYRSSDDEPYIYLSKEEFDLEDILDATVHGFTFIETNIPEFIAPLYKDLRNIKITLLEKNEEFNVDYD